MTYVHTLCLTMAAFLLGSCANLLANGFRLPDQDARATASGEAFVATADNPSAVYYNPAGLTQLPGHNIRLGLHALSFSTEYESPFGDSSEIDDAIHPLPNFYYSYMPEKLPLAFGLGLYSPFGMVVDWPEDTGFRTIALESDLRCMTLHPVVAWKVIPSLSIAAGPTFNFSDLELKQGVTPYPRNDYLRLKGDGWGAGFTAGILWQPIRQLSFGATYRSPFDIEYEGDTTIKFKVPPPGYPPSLKMDNRAEVPFPQSFALGVSYRPTPKWNIEFNADWTGWSRLDVVVIEQDIPSALVLNWDSSWYYEFGVTRDLGRGWHVSAGYIFNQNSVPNRTYNPWIPDQDRQYVSVGGGYRGTHLGVDIAYQYGFASTRDVRGSTPSSMGQTADGRYDYESHAVSVSVGWHF